jgi:hypothetical protein
MFEDLSACGFKIAIIERSGDLRPISAPDIPLITGLHDLYLNRD